LKKDRLENSKTDGILNVLLAEDGGFYLIKELIHKTFDVRVTNEGCKADFIIKPKDNSNDDWVGVQLKAASKVSKGNMYSFNTGRSDYSGMILICVGLADSAIWIVNPEKIKDLTGLFISKQEGTKYHKYYIKDNKELATQLLNLYNSDTTLVKTTLQEFNKRQTAALQQEDNYVALRKSKIHFLPFRDAPNYHVYDFKVNGFKVQEKIAKKDHNQYNLNLHKSYGRNIKVAYHKNDNDFYWIHLDDWKTFYVIPEEVLIQHGHITENDKIGNKHIGIYPPIYPRPSKAKNIWLDNYMFQYGDLDENKLKEMFKL
jgi:hypothetical protein